MELLLTLFTAGAASLAIVPLMMRLAPRLGMVDQPNSRKVHVYPIPRVGGWGIVLGALGGDRRVGAVWTSWSLCYVFGVVVLFAFGAWDDRRELGHYTKFIGQLVAVAPVVFIAGLYVVQFPVCRSARGSSLGRDGVHGVCVDRHDERDQPLGRSRWARRRRVGAEPRRDRIACVPGQRQSDRY